MSQMFCESCGSLIDSKSRGCDNAKCEDVDAIALSLLEHVVEDDVRSQEKWLEHDNVLDRAFRRAVIEGMKRAVDLAKKRANKDRLVAEAQAAFG